MQLRSKHTEQIMGLLRDSGRADLKGNCAHATVSHHGRLLWSGLTGFHARRSLWSAADKSGFASVTWEGGRSGKRGDRDSRPVGISPAPEDLARDIGGCGKVTDDLWLLHGAGLSQSARCLAGLPSRWAARRGGPPSQKPASRPKGP